MLTFVTVIGNREHDQDGDSVIKVYIPLVVSKMATDLPKNLWRCLIMSITVFSIR